MAAGQAFSAFGGLKAASDEKTAAVNDYKRKLGIRRVKWDGQRALYGTRVAEYETQIAENALSASRAYADEQSRLNDLFSQASAEAQESFAQLAENQKYFGSGKSADRLEARNLAKFGRNQAMIASNLIRARESTERNIDNVRDRLRSTNRNAYSKVQFKPQPGFAPVKPNTDMTAANMQFLGGIASAASSGIGAYNSLKAPDIGSFGGTSNGFFKPNNIDFTSSMDFGSYGKVPSSFSFTNP